MAIEFAENRDAVVPSGADAWTDIGAVFVVPTGVKRIKKVRCGVAPDWGLTAISVRAAPVFRIRGAGLQEQDPHEFLGKFAGVAVATTGGLSQNNMMAEYDVDIPVQEGGNFQAQINTLDEAITAGTASFGVVYDDQPATAKNSMSQYIDAAGTTTADALAAVGTITVPKTSPDKDPTSIKKLVIALALDFGTTLASVRATPFIRLTGPGLKGSGPRDYVGELQTHSMCGTSASQGIAQDKGTIIIDVNIEVNAGGQIVVEHQFLDETPTASTIAVGFLYA